MWFSTTSIYYTTNHTDSYQKVEFHKLSSIKFFDNPPDDAMVSIVFDKFIIALDNYEYASRIPEALN